MNIREQIRKDLFLAISDQSLEVSEVHVEVTRTADLKNGDYSTNAAMKLATILKQSPVDIARKLADSLRKQGYVEKVEVAGPGFVNIWIKDSVWQSQVEKVLIDIDRYGANMAGKGKKARVEFVSANPTGPLHFGNARGGPIGDTLARVLEFSGWDVLREYIHNDIGEQVRKLGESIQNVANGQKLEDQEYKGEYIRELATVILGTSGARTPESNISHPELVSGSKNKSHGFPIESGMTGKTAVEVGKQATDQMLDETLADCEAMGIKFDQVYPESGFVQSGDTERAIAELGKKGFIKDKDGAKWFAPHLRQGSGGQANDEFLKDRETVVVKSDGSYTYFSNDIAYHKIKFSEGYDLVIDVFGANHHGHVPRLQAVIKALGGDVSKFHVILYQWVRFKKGGQLVAMSKRSGNFVTAKEVLEMVGADAVRFFILMHDPNSHIDFDLDLAKEKSNKNPVFYVQYAHARISSILAKSRSTVILGSEARFASEARRATPEEKFRFTKSDSGQARMTKVKGQADYKLLATDYELNLIKKISKLPELVEDISQNFGVNALTTYATELADSFHKFYENCRVLPEVKRVEEAEKVEGEEVTPELTVARLTLLEATKITLANTLGLLGISAPEKM
jgi:arginyl-tRNA synthetase